MAGSWPKAQADAQRKRIKDTLTMPKSDATTVTPSIEQAFKSVSVIDVKLISEYLRYARESMADIIRFEERYGNRAPILSVLREYAKGASALLERLQ